MKNLNWYIVGILCYLGANLNAEEHSEDGFKDRVASVRRIVGSVRHQTLLDPEWNNLKTSQKLPVGSVIETGDDGSADLFLNNSVLRALSNTTLRIEILQTNEEGLEKITRTSLILMNGRILGNVKKLASASSYQIKTAAGIAEIKGADFILCSNGKFGIVSGEGSFRMADTNYTVHTGEVFDPGQRVVTIIPSIKRSTEQRRVEVMVPMPIPSLFELSPSSPFEEGMKRARLGLLGQPSYPLGSSPQPICGGSGMEYEFIDLKCE
jgi:hypothetical protein